MNERLLQYIWQFQYFNSADLKTTSGEDLIVLDRGVLNRNQGPDFLHARIRLSGKVWAGNVELHINENDWFIHRHHKDTNYDNVILHVVFYSAKSEGGVVVARGYQIPTLLLEGRVSYLLTEQYSRWMNNKEFVLCGKRLAQVNELVWMKWKERLLVERLDQRTVMLKEWLNGNKHHWEEALWWMIARSFGSVVNSEAFLAVAMSIPYSVISRHRDRIDQLEAMFMGQGGLLSRDFKDEYAKHLLREYQFLKEKYCLPDVTNRMHFLRMRPPAFPTIRLAQLAMLIHANGSLLGRIMYNQDLGEIKQLLNVTVSKYWQSHFVFDEESKGVPRRSGVQLINSVLVNGILPFVYTFGQSHANESVVNRAVEWLKVLPHERNNIVQLFVNAGALNQNAFDSQALLHLKKSYCDKKRCLDCSIGTSLLKMANC